MASAVAESYGDQDDTQLRLGYARNPITNIQQPKRSETGLRLPQAVTEGNGNELPMSKERMLRAGMNP